MAMVNQTNINAIIQKALAKGVSMDKIQSAATQTNQQTGANIQVPTFTQPQTIPATQPATQQPSQSSNFGDLGGASNVQAKPIDFQKQTFQAPSQFAFGQGATQLEQQQQGYLTQRNNFLAQQLLQQGVTDSSSIFENLSSQYQDFAGADMTDRQNTAQAIANRIAQMQAEGEQGQPQSIESLLALGMTREQAEQELMAGGMESQEEAIAGAINEWKQIKDMEIKQGLEWKQEDLERNRTLQQKALDRALEQTRFSINNQIEDVALQAQRNVEMGDKIGALKGFNRSSGYVQGIQNIKDDADRAISRLQQQLAFAEQYTGEDKAQILEDFNKELGRVKDVFNFNMRDITASADIELMSILERGGFDQEKVTKALSSLSQDVVFKREQAIGAYIANTRNAIQITNDQISVLQNYDNFLKSQTEAFTNIINMDGGTALAAMTYQDIDRYVQEGRLLPDMADGYKKLMLGKAINTLSQAGVPTQADIQNLMTAVQGGMSPAAGLMQIIGNNPSRYQSAISDKTVKTDSGVFQYNPATGRYDIPVGSSTSGGTNIQVGQQVSVGGNTYQIMSLGGESSTAGVDFAPLRPGSKEPIGAFLGGEFVRSGTDKNGNRFMEIKHDNGYVYRYNHLDSFENFKAGDRIEQGQNIGVMGNTGEVKGPTGVHLDVGVYGLDRVTNPLAQRIDANTQRQLLLGGGGNQSSGPVGALGIPVSYERSVKNLVPATLMNSEVELKQLNETIIAMHKAGIPQEDAALYFMGFDIQNEENKDLAKSLVNLGRSLPDDMAATFVKSISDFVNGGDIQGAIRKAEQTVLNYAKTQETNYISEGTVRTAVDRAMGIDKTLQGLSNSPVGVVSGTMQRWLGRLKGADAQKIETQITQAVAQMRNQLLGSAVTPSEQVFLDPLIPNLSDTPENFMIKLNNLKNAPLEQYNNIRTTYGLPPLDTNTLLNSNQRVNLYNNQQPSTGTGGGTGTTPTTNATDLYNSLFN